MSDARLKNLNLIRENLKLYISEFAEMTFSSFEIGDINLINAGNGQHRCKVVGDNQEISIDFYYKQDGTTSLSPIPPGSQLSIDLALFIVGKINPTMAAPNASYSVKNMLNDDVKFVIEYLDELKSHGVEKLEEVWSDKGYRLYKYKGPNGDKIVVKHFLIGTLQVQGKPLQLFQEITSLLSQYLPFDEAVHEQEKCYNISLDIDEINTEIEQMLPSAHGIIDEVLKKILVQSLALRKIDINLPDYSGFVFPAMRVLEGYIKHLFYESGIRLGPTFNEFIPPNGTLHVFKLKEDVAYEINCHKRCKAIEEAYNYYHASRHGIGHANSIPEAHVIIEDIQVANDKIRETLDVIERTYRYID